MRAATACLLLTVPALLCAQEFQFRQEFDTIPVEIDGWQPFAPWMGGMSECSPALADIDFDGDLDFFAGQYVGDLYFFENQGSMSSPLFRFASFQFDSITVDARLKPCFRDLDADGDLDLMISDDWPHVLFYRNMGTVQQPDFILEDSSLVPGPPWCRDPELVDLDSDGDFDLFGGNLGNVSYFQNNGTSQAFDFALVTGSFSGINVGLRASPDFVDIDSDGDFDLFVGNKEGKIYYYRNDGTPQQYNFTYITNNYNGIDVGDYASPEFADIDGDGDYDLFVGRHQWYDTSISPGDVFFYENIGTPQAAQWRLRTRNYLSLDVGYLGQMAATDIDADGDRDLFIQNTGDYLSFYENVGTPASPSYHWVTDSYQGLSVADAYPCFADIDDDQDPDLFMGQGAIPGPPGLHLFLNQGTPQSANFVLYSSNLIPGVFTQSSVILAPAVADIDADGDLDLFVSDAEGHYHFFRNVGTPSQPSFSPEGNNWQGITAYATPSFFFDIDEDGDLDLFLSPANDWNLMCFYRNVGSPQTPQMLLETANFLPMTGLQLTYGIDIFDADQDGDGDFMLSTGSGGCLFFRNITGDSTGAVQPRQATAPYRGPVLSIGPNPANPLTIISCQLPVASNISLEVFDISGRKVVELASGFHPPGEYRYVWDASKNASGIYIIRLETPLASFSKTLTIVK